MRHLLEIDDLSASELLDILERAQRPALAPVLERAGVALVFEKPSARTRNSMEMAVVANATGFGVAARGMLGPECRHVSEAVDRFPEEVLTQGGVSGTSSGIPS